MVKEHSHVLALAKTGEMMLREWEHMVGFADFGARVSSSLTPATTAMTPDTTGPSARRTDRSEAIAPMTQVDVERLQHQLVSWEVHGPAWHWEHERCQDKSTEFAQHSNQFAQHSSQFPQHSSQFAQHSSQFPQHSSQFAQHSSQFPQSSSLNYRAPSRKQRTRLPSHLFSEDPDSVSEFPEPDLGQQDKDFMQPPMRFR
eukprot:TRINITY_DN10016_c0_g5_i1.p1 TRINITY_DN10016_c0_g5~~TRINITY_DN10016_c0_g5_i1.p1  ORF type:complete len:200 (-),score=22.73 TRINITY_DN10016_c0_g5_i1:166-765(-)